MVLKILQFLCALTRVAVIRAGPPGPLVSYWWQLFEMYFFVFTQLMK
jgi:hypothetical protein